MAAVLWTPHCPGPSQPLLAHPHHPQADTKTSGRTLLLAPSSCLPCWTVTVMGELRHCAAEAGFGRDLGGFLTSGHSCGPEPAARLPWRGWGLGPETPGTSCRSGLPRGASSAGSRAGPQQWQRCRGAPGCRAPWGAGRGQRGGALCLGEGPQVSCCPPAPSTPYIWGQHQGPHRT